MGQKASGVPSGPAPNSACLLVGRRMDVTTCIQMDCNEVDTCPCSAISDSFCFYSCTFCLVQVGAKMGCSNEVLTVVSMLSVPSVFFRPPDR